MEMKGILRVSLVPIFFWYFSQSPSDISANLKSFQILKINRILRFWIYRCKWFRSLKTTESILYWKNNVLKGLKSNLNVLFYSHVKHAFFPCQASVSRGLHTFLFSNHFCLLEIKNFTGNTAAICILHIRAKAIKFSLS